MKINVTKTGSVTITGLDASEVRLMATVIERGAYHLDSGGPKSDMAVRLASVLREGATRPVRTGPSSARPEECFRIID